VIVVLVSVVALAAVVAAVWQFRAVAQLRTEVAAARDEAARASSALAGVTGERDAAVQSARALTSENDRAAHELREAQARSGELSLLLEAATTGAGTRAETADDGLWRLLLAHVSRRWAAVVGVPPDSRALRAAAPGDQLVEALARETERLREEVGVDVELSVTAAGAGADDADSAERVALLVAVLELLGALASTAERVTVEVGDTLVLTGAGWVDPYRELAAAHETAAAAGVALGAVETGDELVRLIVHHRPSVGATAR
jgi:hypothetical protein